MDQTGFMLNGGGWLLLALVNAGLAEQKNRSRLSWFFVSLFLGFIAAVGANWYAGAAAILSFALGMWALFLYGRASTAARRE